MGFTVEASVPVITVLIQGILSFLSPCVLPLLPLYLGYLSGGATQTAEGSMRLSDRGRVLLRTVCFVAGIGFTFVLLGMGMSAVALALKSRQRLFSIVGGLIVTAFGLYQLGLFGQSAFLSRERRISRRVRIGSEHGEEDNHTPLRREGAACLSAFVLGFFFSFAWTPCVGPTLTTVLLMAGASATRTYGFFLIGVYTLGFCLPFLLTGFFTTELLHFFRKHREIVRYTAKAGGVLMLVTGILMMSGHLNRISSYLATF